GEERAPELPERERRRAEPASGRPLGGPDGEAARDRDGHRAEEMARQLPARRARDHRLALRPAHDERHREPPPAAADQRPEQSLGPARHSQGPEGGEQAEVAHQPEQRADREQEQELARLHEWWTGIGRRARTSRADRVPGWATGPPVCPTPATISLAAGP